MKILILGGGISGLSAAWFLHKKYPTAHLTLLEKAPQIGGCISTQKKGNFLFEMGPRTFQRARSPKLLELIREAGLENDLIDSDPAAKTRYLWVKGKLRSVQSFWPTLVRGILRDVVAPRGATSEESIHSFATRHFGKKVAELFFDPLAKGVFGGESQKLSLNACFPSLKTMEDNHRSIVWAMLKKPKSTAHGLFTLRHGMQQLALALSQIPIEVHTSCTIECITPECVMAGGKQWQADWIISALPGLEIARLTGIDLALRNELISVVNLGYEGKWPRQGYGYLVPSSEKEELLGQIWDSAVFGETALTRLTSMVRSSNPIYAALEAMRRHLGETREPKQMCSNDAIIPQYDLGHGEKVARFEAVVSARFPMLKLVGNYLSGPSVEACITRASTICL